MNRIPTTAATHLPRSERETACLQRSFIQTPPLPEFADPGQSKTTAPSICDQGNERVNGLRMGWKQSQLLCSRIIGKVVVAAIPLYGLRFTRLIRAADRICSPTRSLLDYTGRSPYKGSNKR